MCYGRITVDRIHVNTVNARGQLILAFQTKRTLRVHSFYWCSRSASARVLIALASATK